GATRLLERGRGSVNRWSRRRWTETGRPKPGIYERDDAGSAACLESALVVKRERHGWAQRRSRETQEVGGGCHPDFHSRKAALAVIPSHIILYGDYSVKNVASGKVSPVLPLANWLPAKRSLISTRRWFSTT